MYYPPDWQVLEPREGACIEATDCIVRLGHYPNDEITIELIHTSLIGTVPVQNTARELDDYDWQASTIYATLFGYADQIKVLSLTDIEVGGVEAVRRVDEWPKVDWNYNVIGTYYEEKVTILNGMDEYYYAVQTTDPDEFKLFLPVADKIVYTIVFLK